MVPLPAFFRYACTGQSSRSGHLARVISDAEEMQSSGRRQAPVDVKILFAADILS